jgi:hypothetical protein
MSQYIRAIRRTEAGGLIIEFAQLTTETVLIPIDEEGNELRGQALYDWLDTHVLDNYIPKGTSLEVDPTIETQLGIDGIRYTTVQLARRANAQSMNPNNYAPMDDARIKALIYEVLAEMRLDSV